jgi:asparagine synthase (glutamine-hydrolysing)
MCGIAGIYDPQGSLGEGAIARMTERMAHRGPDAAGHFSDGSFHLGHRRLSIIDLSESANQPFHSACGRYTMVYNGEVYNFQELASELGMRLRTSSDTEVILEAFAKLGPNFIERLNGMFALAILDRQEHRLHLFRDRIGIKPIICYQDQGLFLFASELKGILALRERLNLEIDRTAVSQFLNLGYIPAPRTIFKRAFKFPAGCRAEFDGNTLTINPYWQLDNLIKSDVMTDEREAEERLTGLLTSSVRYRMISDVPFGTFLSGGIDSSTVTAVAQSLSAAPVRTFSISFADRKHDEAPFAQAVAKHLGTDHHEFRLSEKDALQLLPDITQVYDEPYADSSAAPTMLVSKMARQHVTMTLSGDGGDELFHGYGAYTWAERMAKPWIWAARNPLSTAMRLGNDRWKRAADVVDAPDEAHLRQHIFSQEQYMFTAEEIRQLLGDGDECLPWLDVAPVGTRSLTPAEDQALFDLHHYLPDDLLTKVDRASMRYALEARVPLLDHRIIEFSLNLAPQLKVKGGVQKHLLKKVLYRYVPKNLFDRPKWGFSIPLGQWMKGELRGLEAEYLSPRNVKETGLVNFGGVQDLRRRFHEGEDRLYNRIWLLVVLHKWAAENRIKA